MTPEEIMQRATKYLPDDTLLMDQLEIDEARRIWSTGYAAAMKEREWIRLKSTTPATNKLILACDKYNIKTAKFTLYEFEDDPCWEDADGRALDFYPTHWQTLPEPPKPQP